MPKYIKKKTLKNAIEECPWYHINKNGELVAGANSDEHEPLYKYSDTEQGFQSEEWKSIYELWCRSMEEWANGTATANHFYGREGESK